MGAGVDLAVVLVVQPQTPVPCPPRPQDQSHRQLAGLESEGLGVVLLRTTGLTGPATVHPPVSAYRESTHHHHPEQPEPHRVGPTDQQRLALHYPLAFVQEGVVLPNRSLLESSQVGPQALPAHPPALYSPHPPTLSHHQMKEAQAGQTRSTWGLGLRPGLALVLQLDPQSGLARHPTLLAMVGRVV